MSIDLKKILQSQNVAATTSFIKIQENRAKEWGLYGRDTGIHDLNLAIGGILPTEVITIAGRSGHGKTSILTPMAWASEKDSDILSEFCMFSWELASYKLVDRMVTYKTGLTNRDLMMGARLLSDKSMGKIKDVIDRAKAIRVSYQQKSIGAEEVCAIFEKFCEECKRKEDEDGKKRHPIGVIDYIGLAELDASGIRTYGIGDFYKMIKQTCNKTGGSFVILAQINRGSDNKDFPDRGDLSDSQAIENSSDVLAILHRPEYLGHTIMKNPFTGEDIDAKGKALFRIQKGRAFGVGDFVVSCDISKYRFWSMGHDFDYDYSELYKQEEFWKGIFGYLGKDSIDI